MGSWPTCPHERLLLAKAVGGDADRSRASSWSNCFKEAGSGPRPMPWLGGRLFHKGLAEPLWGELARALRLWWGGWPLSVLTHWFTHQHCSHCSPEQSCLSQLGLLYYSLGGWNNRYLILTALVPGKSRIKILCLVRLTSWFADSHLLASSHGGEQKGERWPRSWRLQPQDLNYPPKSPPPNTITLGVGQDFNTGVLGGYIYTFIL